MSAEPTPWIVDDAIPYLEQLLRPEWKGWEWGAGNSTLWLARRILFLTSVEHDERWVHQIAWRLHELDIPNVEIIHVPKGDAYYEEYADAILDRPDGAFDFIMVDGRARPRCVKNAIPKLAPGGVLLVDDMQRDYYREGTDLIPATWERHDFEGWWNERKVTSVWVRHE